MTLQERFESKVQKTDSCHLWVGCRLPKGYGKFGAGGKHGKTLASHRVAYELYKGEIPEGLCVLHKCDNPPCCNPDHLFLGTKADNNQDARNKKRNAYGDRHGSKTKPESRPKGEANYNAKLTIGMVEAIRAEMGTHASIALKYGISRRHVGKVRQRVIWV